MREYEEVEIINKQIKALTCDICKNTYKYEIPEDIYEIQEFQHLSLTGGYGSIFGDGSICELDICQHCMKEKLEKYIRYIDEEE